MISSLSPSPTSPLANQCGVLNAKAIIWFLKSSVHGMQSFYALPHILVIFLALSFATIRYLSNEWMIEYILKYSLSLNCCCWLDKGKDIALFCNLRQSEEPLEVPSKIEIRKHIHSFIQSTNIVESSLFAWFFPEHWRYSSKTKWLKVSFRSLHSSVENVTAKKNWVLPNPGIVICHRLLT